MVETYMGIFEVLERLRVFVGNEIQPQIEKLREFEKELISLVGVPLDSLYFNIYSNRVSSYSVLWERFHKHKGMVGNDFNEITYVIEGIDSESNLESYIENNLVMPLKDIFKMSVNVARKKGGKKHADNIKRFLTREVYDCQYLLSWSKQSEYV
jgi:hypothetical protein